MTLEQLKATLKTHDLKCALGWYRHHWTCTITDHMGYAFTGRADHIEQAVRLARETYLDQSTVDL